MYTSNQEAAADYLRQANQARAAQHFDKAIALYQQVLKTDASHAVAQASIADLYFRQKQYGLAKDSYIAAMQLSPDNANIHFRLGRIADIQSQLDDAKTYYTHAIHIAPEDFKPYQALGELQFLQKQFTEAEGNYKKAMSLGCQIPTLPFKLGRIAQMDERHDEAIDYFEKAILLNPGNPHFQIALGDSYSLRKRYEEAKDCYTSAVESNPSLLAGYFKLGQANKNCGEIQAARSHYERALSINPNHKPSQNALSALEIISKHSASKAQTVQAYSQASQQTSHDLTTFNSNPDEHSAENEKPLSSSSAQYKITPTHTDNIEPEPHPNGFVEKIWQRLFG